MGPLDHEVEQAFSRMRGAVADLQSSVEQLRAAARRDADTLERQRERLARGDEERAEAARRGDLGVDWQRVQRRVDRGEASLRDVLTGADDSPEAERLRATATRHARELAEAQESLDDDDPQVAQFAEIKRGQAELQVLLAEVRNLPLPPL